MSILSGLRVLDLSWGIAGPMAAGQLADHGACVVRVEPPGGDPYASFSSLAAYDRDKGRIRLDLKSESGRQAVARLVERADVVITSWGPGVAARLGLDADTLRSAHPRLVVCTISGYGASGPDCDRPGYDSLVSARLGAVWEGQGRDGAPVYLSVPVASVGAALLCVIGVMAALLEREDTGIGQVVETSLYDGALAFLSMFWERGENLPPMRTSFDPAAPPSRYRLIVKTFQCADGEYLGIHTGAAGSHARLMEAVGLSDRVPPAPPGQQEKKVLLSEDEARTIADELAVIFASQPRAHWLDLLRHADVTAIPLLRQTEAFDEPQVVHNGVIITVDDPALGTLRQVGAAARFATGDTTARFATADTADPPANRRPPDVRAILGAFGLSADSVTSVLGAAC